MKKILLFLLTFLACTYSAQAEDLLYLLGEFNGWANNDTYLFKYHNGTYTLLVEDGSVMKNQMFKFGNKFGTVVEYGATNTGITPPYIVYPKTSVSNAMSFGEISGAVIFNVYNFQSGVQFDCAITSANLYLRGLNGNWDVDESPLFDRDGYTYTTTVTLSGATQWLIADKEYNTKYGVSTAITSVGTYDLTYNGGQAGFNLPDGTYDLTFDFSTLKLTVAEHSETPTYTDLYIVYKNGDSWDALDEKLKFTTENGTDYVLNDVTITPGATFAIGNSELHFGIDGATMTPAATLAEASNRQGRSNNTNYGKWAETIERNVNIVATLSSVQSWGGRQIDFKVYYVESVTPSYPTVIYYYPGMTQIAAKDQANGVYEATLTLGENASFRFYSDENKSDAASYGPNTLVDGSGNNYEAYTLGETRGMTLTSTNRWQLTNTAGEYTFTVDLKNLTFTVVAKSVTPDPEPEYTKYYLRGDINGWVTPDIWELKTTDGLTYTLNNVTLVSGQQFKIGQAGDSDWVGYGYGSTNGELSIYPDGTGYDIYKDNSGNLKFDYVYDRPVNITFTLESEGSNKATLKVVYVDGAEITYPTLYLRGAFSGEGWATNDDYKFTQSGDIYTLTGVDGSVVKNNQWQIANSDWSYKFGASSQISAEGTYTLVWNNNAGFGELEDAKYDLEYTYSTQTLKVTKQGTVVTYPDLWLRGGFNSTNWGVDDKYKFTCTDGVYTLTGVEGLSNCEFKIGSNETGVGVDWTYGFGGTKDAGVTATINEAFEVYDVVQGQNITIAENSNKFDITFVPDFANKTGMLTISINDPSGIEDVEISNQAPVEFYNLQGVRVEGELTPGLYIRRQGNSASKVLIR